MIKAVENMSPDNLLVRNRRKICQIWWNKHIKNDYVVSVITKEVCESILVLYQVHRGKTTWAPAPKEPSLFTSVAKKSIQLNLLGEVFSCVWHCAENIIVIASAIHSSPHEANHNDKSFCCCPVSLNQDFAPHMCWCYEYGCKFLPHFGVSWSSEVGAGVMWHFIIVQGEKKEL